MFACWKGHINTAKVLVENGAIVDIVNKVYQFHTKININASCKVYLCIILRLACLHSM